MAKTAKIQARIEPGLKKDVEKILEKVGLTTTDAITVFFHQVVLKKGIPFDVIIPKKSANRKPVHSIWDLGEKPVDAGDGITDMSVHHDEYIYS